MQTLLSSFLSRRANAPSGDREIVLGRRRIYILPTRAGVLFAAVLLLMLVGSINYGLNLGLVLTFLLAAFGVTAMLHTFRNLAGLRLIPVRPEPVFAGATAHFGISVHNATQAVRYAIHLTRAKLECGVADVGAQGSAVLNVEVAAPERGLLRPGRLTLHTRFPVGLYHAWSYVELDVQCIVYPKPAPRGIPLPWVSTQSTGELRTPAGGDDFAGLRSYQAGDSLRHIAWKAAARGQALLTKQFHGADGGAVWISLDLVAGLGNREAKLSQLTRWVLDAHAAGIAFGLRLPNSTVGLGTGDRQRDRCLEALALCPAEHAAQAQRPS